MQELSQLLLDRNLITKEKLAAAELEQTVTRERLTKILVRKGFIRQDLLFELLREINPNSLHDEAVFQSAIPAALLIKTRTMVTASVGNTLYVSTLSAPSLVRKVFERYTRDYNLVFTATNPAKVIEYLRHLEDAASGDDRMTWERIFYDAMRARCSDIHILPDPNIYTVMTRLDGILRLTHAGSLDEYIALTSRIKDLSKMDMAERRRPQDGGFSMEYAGRVVSFRVAAIPTNNGEKIVIRILDPDSAHVELDKLGISRVDLWRRAVGKPGGLCLICGPTGSGKTTTLAASLREMNFLERAIYTAEDPVENLIPYATQVNMNELVGLTFSTAIRAFMRADPDVIVMGEVRDLDTALNALKAGETGHMTLATLHTDSILVTFDRLRHIGVQPHELLHLLRGVMVQRLMRTYCSHCKGEGCPVCHGSGYKGREVVSEMASFETAADVQAAIDGKISWRTIQQDARDKVLAGRTSAEEFERVFGISMNEVPA